MNIRILSVTAVSAAVSVAVSAARAQHAGDIGVGIVDNHLATGVYDAGVFVPGQRVFGAELGELFPAFANEPGFDSLPGAFPASSSIAFNILSAVREWDGSSFSTIADERVRIGFGPVTPVLTPTSDVLTPGFGLAVGSNGEWHRHLDFTLQAPAADGVYLLELNLVGDTPSTQASLPFWIVFNQNADESAHDTAIDWANANLVPAPGAAGSLLLSIVLVGARRKRA